jgi:hypothetical protein
MVGSVVSNEIERKGAFVRQQPRRCDRRGLPGPLWASPTDGRTSGLLVAGAEDVRERSQVRPDATYGYTLTMRPLTAQEAWADKPAGA